MALVIKRITALPVISSVGDSVAMVGVSSGVTSQFSASAVREPLIRKTAEFNAVWEIPMPVSSPRILIPNNHVVGTITGVDLHMGAGSMTATLQIADQDGSNASNIGGLSSLSVTTSVQEFTATSANVMLATTTADRRLLLSFTSLVGVGPLYLTLRFQRIT